MEGVRTIAEQQDPEDEREAERQCEIDPEKTPTQFLHKSL
jgi:hypothetical protein